MPSCYTLIDDNGRRLEILNFIFSSYSDRFTIFERQKEQLFYFDVIRTAGLNTIDQEKGSEMISNEMKNKNSRSSWQLRQTHSSL